MNEHLSDLNQREVEDPKDDERWKDTKFLGDEARKRENLSYDCVSCKN